MSALLTSEARHLAMAMGAQAALYFLTLGFLGRARSRAIKAKAVTTNKELGITVWPRQAGLVRDNLQNQGEVPPLFHVACLLAIALGQADTTLVYLAYAFVATRCAHSYVHCTSNYIPARFSIFVLGVVVCAAMWWIIVARIGAATPADGGRGFW